MAIIEALEYSVGRDQGDFPGLFRHPAQIKILLKGEIADEAEALFDRSSLENRRSVGHLIGAFPSLERARAFDELLHKPEVRAPRVNDKRVDEETGERRRFSSRILPRYARRSPKVDDVLPVLYLRGLSTGDFRPALEQLLGEDAAGLSPSTITRL